MRDETLKGKTTISVENNKKRSYMMKIDNTVFIVETEESEAAHETAERKIKKLIEAGIDGLPRPKTTRNL